MKHQLAVALYQAKIRYLCSRVNGVNVAQLKLKKYMKNAQLKLKKYDWEKNKTSMKYFVHKTKLKHTLLWNCLSTASFPQLAAISSKAGSSNIITWPGWTSVTLATWRAQGIKLACSPIQKLSANQHQLNRWLSNHRKVERMLVSKRPLHGWYELFREVSNNVPPRSAHDHHVQSTPTQSVQGQGLGFEPDFDCVSIPGRFYPFAIKSARRIAMIVSHFSFMIWSLGRTIGTNTWKAIGSGPRYQILQHVAPVKKTYHHARTARDSRAILYWQLVFWFAQRARCVTQIIYLGWIISRLLAGPRSGAGPPQGNSCQDLPHCQLAEPGALPQNSSSIF